MKLKHQILSVLAISSINLNAHAEDIITENFRVTSPSGSIVAVISGDNMTEEAYFYLRGESYIYGKSTIIGQLNAKEVKTENISVADKNNNKLVEISEQGNGKANLYVKGYSYISDELVVGQKIITNDLKVDGTITGNFSGNIIANDLYAKKSYNENQVTENLEVKGYIKAKNIDLQGTHLSYLADATESHQAVNLNQLNSTGVKILNDSKIYTDHTIKTLRDETQAEFIQVNKAMQDSDKEILALANKNTAETAMVIRSDMEKADINVLNSSKSYTDSTVKTLHNDTKAEFAQVNTAMKDGDKETLALANKNTAGIATTLRTEMERASINVLNDSKSYTDYRIDKLNQDFQSFKKDAYAATAASLAIASLPQPSNAGYNMVSVGTGTWKGEQGFAFGMSGISEDNKVIYKLAGAGNTQGDFGGSAAIGYQW